MPRGRPKGRTYTETYHLRLTPEQRDQLKKLANKEEKTEADKLRELIVMAFERS